MVTFKENDLSRQPSVSGGGGAGQTQDLREGGEAPHAFSRQQKERRKKLGIHDADDDGIWDAVVGYAKEAITLDDPFLTAWFVIFSVMGVFIIGTFFYLIRVTYVRAYC